MREKKSDSYFDPLRDMKSEWIDEAIDSGEVTKKRTNHINLKMIVSIAACMAVLIVGTTCIIHAEEISSAIRSLFVREQELIDPYATMIDESAETDGVSMRMDKIAKDGDRYIIYLHLSRPEGFEPGYLFHSGIKVEQETSGGWQTRADIPGSTNAENALLAGTTLMEVEAATQELDILLTINSWEYPYFSEVEKDSFRLSIHDLATAQIIEEEGGSVKNLGIFADELSVDFEFDESKIESLPEKVSYHDIDFEVNGSKFKLTEMRYSPMHLELHIEDPIGQTIEIGGKELFATNKLNYGSYSADYQPEKRWYELKPYYTLTDEELEWLDEYHKKLDEHLEWEKENRKEIRKLWYTLKVETTLEDKQCSIGQDFETVNDKYDMNKLILTWYFSKPMYEEDIRSVSFEKYIYEDEEPTIDSEYTIDRIVVWENPNAVNPENGNTAAE